MGNKKTKSKASSNGSRARNGSRSSNAHVAADAFVRPQGRSPKTNGNAGNQNIRTYSIPDYRLEHPDFTVRQHIEKDRQGAEHVRYEVEGDLDGPVPPDRQ